MLQPERDSINFRIPPDSKGELIILFTGSFDILRHQIVLFPIQEDRQDQKQAPLDADEQKLSHIHVRKYESGDQTHRMDSKRSSIRNHPYIKTLESFVIGNNSQQDPLENSFPIRIQSALALVRKNDLARADTIHIFFILLNFTVIFVQWENYILSGILLLTILVVFTLRKTVIFPPKRIFWYKNGTILFLFCLMLGFTYFQENMGLPGSIFLTQILVVKKLFPDNKEDGFLYIFLSLFVFVAIAITSTALWFILFFLGYLMLAILLLSTVSGYGFDEPVNAAIGTRISGKSYFTILVSILFMMGVLFFILPHGEAKEATSS
ncbi:MAG: hypothetical protein PHU93_01510, partial [Candidatus Gracilibacteria bacterium]|nr:hypothetical protein [Candidatus Gracilibacteria bacterium]